MSEPAITSTEQSIEHVVNSPQQDFRLGCHYRQEERLQSRESALPRQQLSQTAIRVIPAEKQYIETAYEKSLSRKACSLCVVYLMLQLKVNLG